MPAKLADLIAGSSEEEEAEAPPVIGPDASDEAKAVRAAIVQAVQTMTAAEDIEVEPENLDPLADELTIAAMDAHNPKHVLKILRKTLLDSECVEEIYCDDRKIRTAFRRALGG